MFSKVYFKCFAYIINFNPPIIHKVVIIFNILILNMRKMRHRRLNSCPRSHISGGAWIPRYSPSILKVGYGASLVAQWLRIRLPVQGTQVRALVQEDATCRGATKPMRHNY